MNCLGLKPKVRLRKGKAPKVVDIYTARQRGNVSIRDIRPGLIMYLKALRSVITQREKKKGKKGNSLVSKIHNVQGFEMTGGF